MTLEERIYSEAFEDGIDYAIQKMFGDEKTSINDILKEESEGAGESAKKDNIFKRGWEGFKKNVWEADKGLRDVATDAEGKEVKKLNWKRLGKRAGVIGGAGALVAVPTALAIRSHNRKKAAAEAAEKEYSEGFEAGVDYAIQKTFGIKDFFKGLGERGSNLIHGKGFRKDTKMEKVGKKISSAKEAVADYIKKNWKSGAKGKAKVLVPAAALASGIGLGGYKLATRKNDED